MVGEKEDMSMEDILSSIRKYVSEENTVTNNNDNKQQVEEIDEPVINLDANSVLMQEEEKQAIEKGPFNKLTEALKTYNKPKKQTGSTDLNMSVDQFLREIVEGYIQKWADKNLQHIVESIVLKEIEKIKSE